MFMCCALCLQILVMTVFVYKYCGTQSIRVFVKFKVLEILWNSKYYKYCVDQSIRFSEVSAVDVKVVGIEIS